MKRLPFAESAGTHESLLSWVASGFRRVYFREILKIPSLCLKFLIFLHFAGNKFRQND